MSETIGELFCESPDCDGLRHECWNCGGEGYVAGIAHDDDPGRLGWPDVTCSVCEGEGGWLCPSGQLQQAAP